MRTSVYWPRKGAVFVRFSPKPVSYDTACHRMDNDMLRLKQGTGPEILWFLHHPDLYTYGVRTEVQHIEMAEKTGLPVYASKRGGLLTFHGPGQRIVYCIMHLRQRNMGVGEYIATLQNWIVAALKRCGIDGYVMPEFVGVWTRMGKVASIGVRVSGGIACHGFAINVHQPHAKGFNAIVPCGLTAHSMAVLRDLNPQITARDVDKALLDTHPFVHIG